jgi:hypothetical protein
MERLLGPVLGFGPQMAGVPKPDLPGCFYVNTGYGILLLLFFRVPRSPTLVSEPMADNFAQTVKQQADIVRIVGEYVKLRKSGANWSALCPFHQEKSGSFYLYPATAAMSMATCSAS